VCVSLQYFLSVYVKLCYLEILFSSTNAVINQALLKAHSMILRSILFVVYLEFKFPEVSLLVNCF
jgi:hypothetical protein